MTRQLDIPEASLRFGSGGVRRHATCHELGHARLEVERDFRVHILLRQGGAVDREPKESVGAGWKHRGIRAVLRGAARSPRQVARAAAVCAAAVRMPLTIFE